YGLPESLNRNNFGGALTIATFQSRAVQNVTYMLYADQASVTDVIPEVNKNCSNLVIPADPNPVAVSSTGTINFGPQEVVQYFRSSSAALLLQGYNNTALWTNSTQDSPLPDNRDPDLLACLNTTIAQRIPITDKQGGLSRLEIGWIVTGAVIGLFLLVISAIYVSEWLHKKRMRRTERGHILRDRWEDIELLGQKH
ncbi:hypothetical protein H0H87_009698, partial [Tephrocybe sp. NHM501043]